MHHGCVFEFGRESRVELQEDDLRRGTVSCEATEVCGGNPVALYLIPSTQIGSSSSKARLGSHLLSRTYPSTSTRDSKAWSSTTSLSSGRTQSYGRCVCWARQADWKLTFHGSVDPRRCNASATANFRVSLSPAAGALLSPTSTSTSNGPRSARSDVGLSSCGAVPSSLRRSDSECEHSKSLLSHSRHCLVATFVFRR